MKVFNAEPISPVLILTPAGKRHSLEFINILDDNGRINANGTGQFAGQGRFEVRLLQRPGFMLSLGRVG